jgi:hypothetical protein
MSRIVIVILTYHRHKPIDIAGIIDTVVHNIRQFHISSNNAKLLSYRNLYMKTSGYNINDVTDQSLSKLNSTL